MDYFKQMVCLFEENVTNDVNNEKIINTLFPNIYLISLYEDDNKIRSTRTNIVLRNIGVNYTILNMRRPSSEEYSEYAQFHKYINGQILSKGNREIV